MQRLLTSAQSTASRLFTTLMTASGPNRSGLLPEESKKLATREPTEAERPLLEAMKEVRVLLTAVVSARALLAHLQRHRRPQLYSCAPKNSTYDIYAPNATFHDPIGLARGLDQIRAQFNGLPKLFAKSTVDRMVVLENPASLPATTTLIDQDVTYYMKPDKPTKTINSLVTLERDEQGKVLWHQEEWGHRRETDKNDGFFGMLNEGRKTLSARLTGAFVPTDASKV